MSLFAELPREVLARLVSEVEEFEFTPGQTVFSRGDPGDALYVVVSGAVEVRGEGGAILAGFLLSLPYWRALGLVTG